MASTRLPGKPLADIAGEPMIVHCWRRAVEADVGPVIVACAEREIAVAVEAAGGTAVLTAPDLPSGSDRAAAALAVLDPDEAYDAVLNLQADLPTLDPVAVRAAYAVLATQGVEIATLACLIAEDGERSNPNVVKAVVALQPGATQGRALYFSRATVQIGRASCRERV